MNKALARQLAETLVEAKEVQQGALDYAIRYPQNGGLGISHIGYVIDEAIDLAREAGLIE